MASKRRPNKGQPSAASILSETEASSNMSLSQSHEKLSQLVKEAVETCVANALQPLLDNQRTSRKGNDDVLSALNSINKRVNDLPTTELAEALSTITEMKKAIEFLKAKYVSLSKQINDTDPAGSCAPDQEILHLKDENRALRKEVGALKEEMKNLKDEFLMNLDRQHEDALVIHGLPKQEDESEKELQEKSRLYCRLKPRQSCSLCGCIPSGEERSEAKSGQS